MAKGKKERARQYKAAPKPARQRDFKAEYQRRVEKGKERGKSRTEARGHAVDRKGAVAASDGLSERGVIGYLARLRGTRSVKVMATFDDGSVREVARGRAESVKSWLKEQAAEDVGTGKAPKYEPAEAVSFQVIYTGGR